MDGKTRGLIPAEVQETLDDPLPGSPISGDLPPPNGRRQVALVEGSGPQMSAETRCLLRRRLRIAALTLLAGFAVFLVYHIVNFDPYRPLSHVLLGVHVALTLLLAACGAMLCRGCEIGLGFLRLKELVIFGGPAAFFVLLHYVELSSCAEKNQILPNPTGAWLVLMFTYAMFIPNTWRRAGLILGAMAITPVALTILLVSTQQSCSMAANAGTLPIRVGLMMGMGLVTSVLGVHTIGALRRQAFEAQQLGQYRLKQLIGSGGMGEVYLAEHQLLKRPCAVKLIRPEKAGDPKMLARFEREVRQTAKLSHWNSIEIFDYGHAQDGTFYYAMEFLPGMNLNDLVAQYGPLPSQRVIHFLAQTCDALAEAHAMGLIHRDIKPANIFAAQRGGVYDVAKLLDFGLAKATAERGSAQLTQDGNITGSPLYMAPEQATGDSDADARSDIYSLGGVGYFLATGRPPFDGEHPIKVMVAHVQQDVPPPSQLREDIDPLLEEILLRCLAKRPQDRFQSVQELREALGQCESAGRWTRGDADRWWLSHDRTAPEREPAEVWRDNRAAALLRGERPTRPMHLAAAPVYTEVAAADWRMRRQ